MIATTNKDATNRLKSRKHHIHAKVCVLFFLVLFWGQFQGVAVAGNLHPRNKILINKGLIPPIKYFPEVPRITPKEAFGIYYANKALFIGVGHDAARLKGHWVLLDYMHYNPARLKKIPKSMKIITYCG